MPHTCTSFAASPPRATSPPLEDNELVSLLIGRPANDFSRNDAAARQRHPPAATARRGSPLAELAQRPLGAFSCGQSSQSHALSNPRDGNIESPRRCYCCGQTNVFITAPHLRGRSSDALAGSVFNMKARAAIARKRTARLVELHLRATIESDSEDCHFNQFLRERSPFFTAAGRRGHSARAMSCHWPASFQRQRRQMTPMLAQWKRVHCYSALQSFGALGAGTLARRIHFDHWRPLNGYDRAHLHH